MAAHPTCDRALWDTWRRAASDPVIDAALRAAYDRLDERVAAGHAVCELSGRCCDFDAFGHRMYVTGIEVTWVVGRVESRAAPERAVPRPEAGNRDAATGAACPYQIQGLCTVHAMRPMGCRVFFCQAGTQTWQRGLYERCLSEIRALHDEHGLPYRYLEWRQALREERESRQAGG